MFYFHKLKIIGFVAALFIGGFIWNASKPEALFGATVCFPYQGCTGTGTIPTTGQLLVGNSSGTYTVTSTIPGLVISGTTTFSNIASSSILYTGANGVVTGSSTLLSFSGSNVGIGTSSPTFALDVIGTGQFTNTIANGNATTTGLTHLGTITYAGTAGSYVNDVNLPVQIIGSAAQYGVSRTANTYGLLFGSYDASTYAMRSIQSSDKLCFVVNNTNQALCITPASGNVGIGDPAPNAKLSVGTGSIVDSNVPLQLSTSGDGTQTNIGLNKNGAYGLLLGYLNKAALGGIGSWEGSYFRNIAADPLAIVMNSTKVSSLWSSAGDVALGGNITNSTTYTGATMVVKSTGNVGIGTSTFSTVNPERLKVDSGTGTNNAVVAFGNVNDFLQFDIKNLSTGLAAQSGYSSSADTGSSTTLFMWMGINNSGFNNPQPYNVGGALDTSLMGAGMNMYVVNTNPTSSLFFLTGGVNTSTNNQMQIDSDGAVLIVPNPIAINNTSTLPMLSLNDPSVIPSIIGGTTYAVYSDDPQRMMQFSQASGGTLFLRNRSFASAAQVYNSSTAQTLLAATLGQTGGAFNGAVTYQGYHYILITSSTLQPSAYIYRATSSPLIDISVQSSWVTTTISGNNITSTSRLIGAANGSLYFASSTTVITPFTITTSTNAITSGTSVTITGANANCTIIACRVNDNGIYAQFSAAPFLRKFDLAGNKIRGISGMLTAAPTNGPDVFATKRSIYGLAGGSTTLLQNLAF